MSDQLPDAQERDRAPIIGPARPGPEAQADRFGLQFSRVVRVSGLAIAFWETFFQNVDRPGVLALAGAMMSGSLVVDAIIKRGKGS